MLGNSLCKQESFAYRGYVGSIEADVEAGILHGRILGIGDIISYEGDTLPNLRKDFENSVDDYIEHCRKYGKKPERSFSGKILLRISPELHGRIAMEAQKNSASINFVISSAIEQYLKGTPKACITGAPLR